MLKLGWDSVKDGIIVVKGGREKSGVKQRVGISPALAEVLDELPAEYRRTPNLDRRVFTTGGKPDPESDAAPRLRQGRERRQGRGISVQGFSALRPNEMGGCWFAL